MMPHTEKPCLNRSRIVACVIVAWLFVISVLSFADHAALSELRQQSDRADEQAMVEALQINIAKLMGQVSDVSDRLDDEQHVSADVQEKLLSLEQAVQQVQERYQQSPDVREALIGIMNRLDQMGEQIRVLQQTPETVLPTTPTSPASPVSKETPKPRSYPQADFVLLGVELRGDQRLLSVAPNGSRSIGEIRLLRPGESIGVWQLKSFDNTQATFTAHGSHGRSQTFTIPKTIPKTIAKTISKGAQ